MFYSSLFISKDLLGLLVYIRPVWHLRYKVDVLLLVYFVFCFILASMRKIMTVHSKTGAYKLFLAGQI